MSDTVKIDVDTAALSNIKNSLTNAKQKMESGPKATVTQLKSSLLTTPEDFASSYLDEMVKSIDEIINATNERVTGIDTLIASLETSEPADNTSEPIYSNPAGDDDSSSSSGKKKKKKKKKPSTGDDDNDDDDDDDDDDTQKPPKEVSIPVTSLGNIPVSSMVGLMTSLINLASVKKKGLDELFKDTSFADDIKKALLESGFLPDDLKKILTDNDSIVTLKLFKSIVNGEYPEIFGLGSLNVGVIHQYLKNIAEGKGITLEQLLSSSDYVNDLQTALKSFEGTSNLLKDADNKSSEEYQKTLSETYNGNVSADIKEETVNILRTFVDYVAEESEISSEELLNNTAYAEVLKVASQGFAKSSVYAEICGAFSQGKIGSHTETLILGGNPEALDITKDEQTKFKAEVDSLAKSKGTTSEKLLTDATYAQDVRKLLEDSTNINGADSDTGKSTKFVSDIYKNEDAKVSQKVANNIYKAQVDDSTTFVYKPVKTINKTK